MENASNDINKRVRRIIEVLGSILRKREVLVTALICILVSSGLGYVYYTRVWGRRGIVGIIRIEGPIVTSEAASRYIELINQVMINESIRAVALVVDSPGGYAELIEEVYLDLLELKKKKPLIASIVQALSGGYYIAVAADYIYVNPTSYVGNIGVIGSYYPPVLVPSEFWLETGPYKVTGFSRLLFPHNLSHALDNFVSAVEMNRGDRLKLSSVELKRGLFYLGSEAIGAGLADEVGSLQKAIGEAARKGGLIGYDVTELSYRSEVTGESSSYGSLGWENLTVETLERLHPPPAIYYLYLPPGTIAQVSSSSEPSAASSSTSVQKGNVLVDVSHGNSISWWELDILIGELAQRGMTVSFVPRRQDLESVLDNASCLIVASPADAYSAEESNRIERFVKEGGLLLLFFDPAWAYVQRTYITVTYIVVTPGLFAPINSLSIRFGFSFAKGYLYNEDEHFGIYRNIYVKNFASSPLTENLRSLVLFTATYIHSMDKGVAWTSNSTYSSVAEKADNYATMVSVEKGNGTVVAFGDLTFLREPYCYVEDNYEFILNLVSLMIEREVPVEGETEDGVEEEVTRPDLPVGTEKNYTELVDGEEHLVRWFKVNETLTKIERPDETSHNYFDNEGALWKWESDGTECVYEDPLPESPYPLTKGEKWEYESNYTLALEGNEYAGRIWAEEEVEGFEEIVAGNNKMYFCARVRYMEMNYLTIQGLNQSAIRTGQYWVSSEAGTVKQETITRYYLDGAFGGEERRTLLLESIRKG